MAPRRHPGPAHDALTRREADVLEAIGRRLTNGEIAEQFHVSVRTVESHIAALRRKLSASSRGELIAAAAELARSAVVGGDAELIGRDDDLDAVMARMEGGGLVTLVGPAGVGKSRLAREVARRSAGEVRLVDLVGVETDGVAVAVADGVGVGAAEGTDIAGGLRLALTGRSLLLVVDNADLVSHALAEVVADLLANAGGLQVLVTSRRRLGLAAEVVQTVGPLALPDADDMASVVGSAAVRLLVDRAAAVRADFAVSDGNAASVAALCRRLDGLPLAIELAAARLGSVGVAELEAMLGDHMDVLGRPDHSGVLGRPDQAASRRLDRHSSLAAAVDWSWSVLSGSDRTVLQAAACLPGPCSLDELRHVVEGGRVEGGRVEVTADVARSVLDLVDQSMLEPRLQAGQPSSYRVLETIRAVAMARTDADRAEGFRAAHARYHAVEVEGAVQRSRAGLAWPYDDDPSRRNLLGALRWAAANDPTVGARLLSAIAKRYELAPTVAVLDELRRVVREHAIPDNWPTEPLAWAAVALNYLDLQIMAEAADEALARAEDAEERALGEWAVGFAASYLGRTETAGVALGRAEASFRQRGDLMMAGMCLMALGLGRPDPVEAVTDLEGAFLTFLEGGGQWHAQSMRLMLARRAIEAGVRLDDVPQWLDDSDRFLADRDGLRHDRAHALAARAEWAEAKGDSAACRRLGPEAVTAFRQHGDLRCLVRAHLLVARTEPDPALALVEARRAVDAALLQADPHGQADALDLVIALADSADEPALGARARGAKLQVAGVDRAPDVDDGPMRAPFLEGLAQGPSSVALGAEDPGR